MNGLGIQSVEIAIEILKVIGGADEPLTIGEIAERVDMSKSRLHRYLTSLFRTGFVRRDNRLCYTVGRDAMTLGLTAVRRFDMREETRPMLMQLREQLNETVALSVWTEQGPYYLHWVESQRAVNVGIRVGAQVSALRSAGGKVFLAYLPERATAHIVGRELAEFGISRADYEEEMALVRERGYAMTEESLLPGIATVGCPVFHQAGDIAATVTVVGILGHLDMSPSSPVVARLQATCAELSAVLP